MSKISRILHVVPSVGPKSAGVGTVALNLAMAQQRLGYQPQIWCHDSPEDVQWASRISGFPQSDIRTFMHEGPRFLFYSPQMEQEAAGELGQSFDVIHQHGLWTGISRVSNRWCENAKGIKVISPHGFLQSWSLNSSKWKKKLAFYGYEKQNLTGATCLHATAAAEINDFRKFGLVNPIALIPNGISYDWIESQGNANLFKEKFRIPREKRMVLFLSRITPKKGILMLLKSLAIIKNLLTDWIIVIAGTDEQNHRREIEKVILEYKLNDTVLLLGPLFGQDKRDAFEATDIFVLPSYSEGFPIIVLEALGAGVPVLTTKASPWEELVRFKCGWWSEINIDSLTHSLIDAISLSQPELEIMGKYGRDLVASRYTWERISQQIMVLYNWLAFQSGSQPEFLRYD